MTCCLLTVHWTKANSKSQNLSTFYNFFLTCCFHAVYWTLSFYTRQTTFVTCCLLTVHRTLHYIQGRHFCDLLFALLFTELFKVDNFCFVCLLFTETFIIYKRDYFCDFLFANCSLNVSLYTRETIFATCCLLIVHWTLYCIQGRQLLTSCLFYCTLFPPDKGSDYLVMCVKLLAEQQTV